MAQEGAGGTVGRGPRERVRQLVGARHRVGRTRVVTQLQALARANEAVVEVDIAPDVRFGSGVRFLVQRGTRNVVRLGPGCRVFEDVTFELRGGQLLLGENVEVRRGSYMGIGGRFECQARNIISYYNLIHCAESIVLEEYASTNEFVSLIDSTHHHDGPSEFFYENVSAAPIHVGPNVWICSKATVLMGVTIGPNSVVASHAVVNRDVPPGVVVGGLPARVLGERAVDGPALRFFG